ncbi:MAG: helix-turn-helix transcriptional regulator [Alphaproteobacteria bacterium]
MGKTQRIYSRYTNEALKLLSGRIKVARVESGITAAALAERAGISRDLLYRIENADPSCSIGVVFEVASLLGVQLFSSDLDELKLKNKFIEDKLALLPAKVKPKKIEVDDDF